MHGLTKNWIENFQFLKIGRKCRYLVGSFIWAGVFSSLCGLLSRSFFSEPSADTSARRPASKRGEDRTAGRAIGYAFITSTPATAPSSSFHPVPLFLFAHSPAKRRGGRECREVLPVPSDYGAQVQTGGAITAEPDACRPIITIIESHKNRVPSDN